MDIEKLVEDSVTNRKDISKFLDTDLILKVRLKCLEEAVKSQPAYHGSEERLVSVAKTFEAYILGTSATSK